MIDLSNLKFTSKKISPALVEILKAGPTKQGNVWVMDPTEQLSAKLYKEYRTLVETLRGKWNRKNHVFDYDPTDVVAAIVANGYHVNPNPYDYYESPPVIVDEVLSFLPKSLLGLRILEPSAGTGAIAEGVKKKGNPNIDCCELNPFNREVLQQKGFKLLDKPNFLEIPVPGRPYDLIVMNPPFDKSTWLRHILHAMKFLKGGGKLVAVCLKSGLQSANLPKTLDQEFVQLMAAHGKCGIVEGQVFEGTKTEVGVICISKPSNTNGLMSPCQGYPNFYIKEIMQWADSQEFMQNVLQRAQNSSTNDAKAIAKIAFETLVKEARKEFVFLDYRPEREKEFVIEFMKLRDDRIEESEVRPQPAIELAAEVEPVSNGYTLKLEKFEYTPLKAGSLKFNCDLHLNGEVVARVSNSGKGPCRWAWLEDEDKEEFNTKVVPLAVQQIPDIGNFEPWDHLVYHLIKSSLPAIGETQQSNTLEINVEPVHQVA